MDFAQLDREMRWSDSLQEHYELPEKKCNKKSQKFLELEPKRSQSTKILENKRSIISKTLQRVKTLEKSKSLDYSCCKEASETSEISCNHQSTSELRSLTHTRPDVAFFRTDNEFLGRFLAARKNRVEAAFQVLCKYFLFRHQSRELCVGLSVNNPGVQAALLDGTVGVLPERDPAGRPIIVVLASNWNCTKYDVRTIYQALLITLEHLIEDIEVQRKGVIAVVDWSHFPSKYATTLSPKTLRIFLEGLQDSFPMRLGAIHVVSPPWYVDAALSLTKPFLKDKLKGKILVHGNNLHGLHKLVPPRLLPAELGGEGGEFNAHLWAKTLIPPNKIIIDNGVKNTEKKTITDKIILDEKPKKPMLGRTAGLMFSKTVDVGDVEGIRSRPKSNLEPSISGHISPMSEYSSISNSLIEIG